MLSTVETSINMHEIDKARRRVLQTNLGTNMHAQGKKGGDHQSESDFDPAVNFSTHMLASVLAVPSVFLSEA